MNHKTEREDFFAAHGPDYVLDGNFFLFADGAKAEQSSYGVLLEPPADAFNRADLHVRYQQLRLAKAQSIYDKREEHWREVIKAIENGNHLDTYRMEPELLPLRKNILLIQDQLKEAELARDELPPPEWYRRQQGRQAELSQAQQRASGHAETLNRLRI